MADADIARAALDAIARADGLDYADARVVRSERDHLSVRDGTVDRAQRAHSAGIGVRALVRGAWGFAAEPDPSPAAAERAARRALAIARGVAAAARDRVRLAEEEPQRGHYATPVAVDPFAVPLDRRVADLVAATDAARDGGDPRVRAVEASMQWHRIDSALATTEGTLVTQNRVFGGAGLAVTCRDGDATARRSYPIDYDGGLWAAGYEVVDELALVDHAHRLREEALELLSAPDCPAGRRALVLDTPQLALQIHESCGHPAECDRALGDEVSLAGASFLTPDRLGRFHYGSPRVNLTADATTPRGLGTFGWDDEGVPARRTPLVSRGVFVGYLSSRETAEALGLGRSAGCMRAESWDRPPIIRMINVSLEPDPDGPASLDELIADTDDGVLMTVNRSWSIDDLRLNFQFSCEVGWEIARGRRTRMVRNPLYTGSTPAFWRGCDAIGNATAWRIWGLASCGKGDPMQAMGVAHGCAPARFRDVEIGCSRG
ncbi:MAG: TldD/PmbA family protein [Deltaproteobacteria bacterium]|nr:MAG: TldD/PmbA family protein [Deltaproteobacteria bacterium]